MLCTTHSALFTTQMKTTTAATLMLSASAGAFAPAARSGESQEVAQFGLRMHFIAFATHCLNCLTRVVAVQ